MKELLRYLIVPDSFKDCMTAIEMGRSIEKGILDTIPDAKIKVIPMSDRGEGFFDAILHSIEGYKFPVLVFDPLLREIENYFGIINNGSTAIIEMATANGLELLSIKERDPWQTSTYGTGQMLLKALDLGCTEITIGIGGSATNDGGLGMAKALGIKFFNKSGLELGEGGGVLDQLHTIDSTGIDARIQRVSIKVATDVINKICGADGASRVYAAQKGANKSMIQKLERNMEHFATMLDLHYGVNSRMIEGGGAAGGLGAGLSVFCGAQLDSGFNTVSQLIQLEKFIGESDIILTAEGAIDNQTKYGKVPAGLGILGLKKHKPVYVFAGTAPDSIIEIQKLGITAVIPICRRPVSVDEAIKNGPHWLRLSAAMVVAIVE